MAAIPSYRAELIGLSERDKTLLRSLLAASQARSGVHWDGGANQPAVYFIDVDSQAGAEFWQSLTDNQRRDSAIALSISAPAGANCWLPKPLRSTSLLSALEQLSLSARAPAAVAAPNKSPRPTPAPAARAVDPSAPLNLLNVLDAAASPTAQAVQSPHWPDLVLASGSKYMMRTAPLERYAEGFATSIEVSRMAKYTGGPLDDEQRLDLDTIRWLVMLHAPLAEISQRMPNPARVRLRTLPAFGHLPHNLLQVRMAAWLVQHPATPLELAEMVGVDDETVQRFLGACDAIGLMQEVAEPAFVVTESVPEPMPEPQPVIEAAAPIVAAEAEVVSAEAPVEAVATDGAEATASLSVLERLRATREQNRARVAAAIRTVSGK